MPPRNFSGTGRRPGAYWVIMSLSCLGVHPTRRGTGGSGRGERRVGICADTAAPVTQTKINEWTVG